ncbi:hypothetical protein AB1N83_013933 [Pleurotus pulmonarius]
MHSMYSLTSNNHHHYGRSKPQIHKPTNLQVDESKALTTYALEFPNSQTHKRPNTQIPKRPNSYPQTSKLPDVQTPILLNKTPKLPNSFRSLIYTSLNPNPNLKHDGGVKVTVNIRCLHSAEDIGVWYTGVWCLVLFSDMEGYMESGGWLIS